MLVLSVLGSVLNQADQIAAIEEILMQPEDEIRNLTLACLYLFSTARKTETLGATQSAIRSIEW